MALKQLDGKRELSKNEEKLTVKVDRIEGSVIICSESRGDHKQFLIAKIEKIETPEKSELGIRKDEQSGKKIAYNVNFYRCNSDNIADISGSAPDLLWQDVFEVEPGADIKKVVSTFVSNTMRDAALEAMVEATVGDIDEKNPLEKFYKDIERN